MGLCNSELSRRLANLLPGSEIGGQRAFPNSKIYFEPVSMDGLYEMDAYSRDERLYEFFEFELLIDEF